MSQRLPRRRRARFLLAVLGLGLFAAGLAVARPVSPSAAAAKLPLRGRDGARPNVLLVTIDTLRMDHLGAYGYRLPTSPAIDRLAGEGVLFTDAITPIPMTAPALASLLTGQHVQRHHVHLNVGTFPENVGSLAEAFAASGYDTAGFYGNEAVEEFGRGFGVWEEFPRKIVPRGRELADVLGVERALAWLADARKPWFLWLHFIDPHGPYDSSPAERSASFAYPDAPDLELETSDKNWVFGAIPRYQQLPGAHRVVDYLRRYDGEIVGTDLQIARLRKWLEDEGELEDTVIVLTADHGESLGEDKYFFQHGKVLNEASLRVPLIVRHPSLPGGTKVDAPVSLIDVYPTLATLVGLPVPTGIAGRDVSPAIFGAEMGERLRITYTVTPDLSVAVMKGPWRLRGRPGKKKDGAVAITRFPRVNLFDTSVRPEKPVPLADQPETVRALRKELVEASRRVRTFEAPPTQVTGKQKERLRALGYVE